MLTIKAIGEWRENAVRVEWADDARRRLPEVEARIELAWNEARARLGERLFDGPMCRLERCEAHERSLHLWVSPTTYKPFLGTNLTNPDAPADVRANPVGLSAALVTRDGWLMLGKRNAHVAYYPNRIHPFAGSLEPAEVPNLFDGVRRELREELNVAAAEAGAMTCLGIVEDAALRQPEVVVRVDASLARAEIESRVNDEEHHACIAVELTRERFEEAMRDPLLTPVAVGTLALLGRVAFGDAWFERQRPRFRR